MPGVVAERDLLLVPGPLVGERDREAAVEERHHLQALGDRRGAELDLLEHVGIGPERDRRAGVPALRRGDRAELALRHAGLHRAAARALLDRVLLAVRVAVAVDLEHQARRQRVHDRHADAVQPARDLVAAPAELAARVQGGHHDLGRRASLVLRVLVDRDAAAVVGDAHPAVGRAASRRPGAVAGHRLVDRVVDDLPHEVVQTRRARWTRCTCPAACGPGRGPRAPGCARPSTRSSPRFRRPSRVCASPAPWVNRR